MIVNIERFKSQKRPWLKLLDLHKKHGGHSVRINISSQWDDGTDAEFCRHTDRLIRVFFFCRRYDITDITLQSQGYISNVDAHTRVLAADTVCRAPDNAILCR